MPIETRDPKKPKTETPKPAPKPVDPEPKMTPGYTIGSYGNPSIDKWDSVIIAASDAVLAKRGVRVDPRVMKSIMGVESRQDGTYPPSQCRPCDGEDCVPACGPFQIKERYHKQRCPECNFKTVAGQAELATHIIGMTMREHRLDEIGAFLKTYFPADDVNGTTQREYAAKIRADVAAMKKDAGETTAPAPAPKPIMEQDILNLISNNAKNVHISFGFAERNTLPGGRIYSYGKGHGAGLIDDDYHPGVDMWMPDETPVNAIFGGEVVCVGEAGRVVWGQGCGYFSDDDGGLGNITILTDAYATIAGKKRQLKMTYGHMSSAVVKVGQRIKDGERIGRSGVGGDWPHIHLDVTTSSPERNNPRIWNNPGDYHLEDPIPTIINALGGALPDTRPLVLFAGASVAVPLSVPFRQVLIPKSQKNQRPGTFMDPDRFIAHETGNYRPGADAQNHLEYLQRGAPDEFGNPQQLGYHLAVDQDECIQMIPFDEVTWHGGDSGGVCNMRGLSMEICVHDNNAHKTKTRANAEEVTAAAMLAKELTILERHGDCCARIGNPADCHVRCPESIGQDNYWTTYVAKVNALRAGEIVAPAPTYASPVPPPAWDGEDKLVGKVLFRAAQRVYVAATNDVPVLRYADRSSQAVRAPLPKGEKFTGWYLVESQGESWVVTKTGARIPASACTPILTVR